MPILTVVISGWGGLFQGLGTVNRNEGASLDGVIVWGRGTPCCNPRDGRWTGRPIACGTPPG